MLDIKKLLEDLNIPYNESGKDWQPGWVNITCPFCDDPEHHGGFNIVKAYYNCWRCGHHKVQGVLQNLLGVDIHYVFNLMKSYQTGYIDTSVERQKGKALTTELPDGCKEMNNGHRLYLVGRKFNALMLEKEWGLQGTGHLGDYKFRIIIPIYLNNRLVSYQGRDITGLSDLRYKACKIENEMVHHKHTLYGIDNVLGRRCVIVEGVTDVWRLGFGAVSCFGTEFTLEQVLMLGERMDYVGILFDNATEATLKADKLSFHLQSIGVQTEEFQLTNYDDPAEMDQFESQHFMSSIL